MKLRQTLTPTMLRTRYHERRTPAAPAGEPRSRPQLAADDNDFEATADWLAHIEAGRITVR